MRRLLARCLLLPLAVGAVAACGDDPTLVSEVCPAIEGLDPTALLGGPPTEHRSCEPNDSFGSLGVAVWTAADGRRVSVSLVSNDAAGKPIATFGQLYDGAPEDQRCEFRLPDSPDPRRCVNKLNTGQTETGTFMVDLGSAAYLVVWLSDVHEHQAGLDVPVDSQQPFLDFVGTAVTALQA